ncbi:hypothetical protein CEXT_760601 [Caerostris extrusa]|uniref:Uncharacterized protein n=1 Tax=Caerostris extrusa TaxID=172846 RepID=A0AAV4VP06_CAEEX|nr:hypothetical protein CEXT_760601 [Caerostris extrusa]
MSITIYQDETLLQALLATLRCGGGEEMYPLFRIQIPHTLPERQATSLSLLRETKECINRFQTFIFQNRMQHQYAYFLHHLNSVRRSITIYQDETLLEALLATLRCGEGGNCNPLFRIQIPHTLPERQATSLSLLRETKECINRFQTFIFQNRMKRFSKLQLQVGLRQGKLQEIFPFIIPSENNWALLMISSSTIVTTVLVVGSLPLSGSS